MSTQGRCPATQHSFEASLGLVAAVKCFGLDTVHITSVKPMMKAVSTVALLHLTAMVLGNIIYPVSQKQRRTG